MKREAAIWSQTTHDFKNKDYPNFKPAQYITFLSSGYLNGGHYVERGCIMKLVPPSQYDWDIKYQGFKLAVQNMLTYGKTDVDDNLILPKCISSIEQYLKIKGDWFRESTREEIEKFEGWINNCLKENK